MSRSSRRLIAAALAANLACGVLAVPPAFAEPTTATPVLRYDFDGDLSGGVVTDRSGGGRNGTLVNPGSATQVDGTDGTKALQLPGGPAGSTTAPYVSVPNGLFKDLTAATIATRVKWAGGADFQWVYCIGKDQNSATFVTPSFSGVAKTRSSIKPVNGSAEVGVDATAKLPAGQWVNLVTTIDGTALRYYLNGVRVGSATASVNLAATMYAAANSTSGFLGKPFWSGHPFFAGAMDDFRVYDSALTDDQVATLAGSDLATLTTVGKTSFAVTTTVGTAPVLPAVTGSYSDGIDRVLPVTWNAIDPARYAQSGTFTVNGVVTGRGVAVSATVRVIAPGDLTIDLGTNTGAFHGGASGTLYGVYGDGVPSRNLIEGMGLRTVSTKAQDGPQHPGADALEVVKPLADSTGGDVYIYMTDIYRGFPYEWPGTTPKAKLDDFKAKIATQVDQVLTLAAKYREHVVFVPFNEPEGNMFGTGQWSYNSVSWLDNPRDFYAAWDEVHALIKKKMPDARIAGPNTSILYDQDKDFLRHTVAAGTVPEVFSWHELGDPARIRTSVARYRAWEDELFAGTRHAGRHLPININEYAFNYHTSVPGQMIQWVSAIEDSKVDADIAYWNIDGNLSDSAVQENRANGQWWLLHSYAQMSGHTVQVTPPFPGQSYTMQGVATLDPARSQARALIGGASGTGTVTFANVDRKLFGSAVRVLVQEIPWSGQLGDSAQPRVVADFDQRVTGGKATVDFGSRLPAFDESSAYQIILSPGRNRTAAVPATNLWTAGYEAEDAAHTGSGYSRNGPEGTPSDVGKFYTSGTYNVGGLRTGSDLVLDFSVEVPTTGVYDLSVFANSLNTYGLVAEQGPTNAFLRVDGKAEQELFLPLGYKWVVWDHTDTKVSLTAGKHTISLAARSLDGTRATKGDAIVDRVTLTLPNPAATASTYEAGHATLRGARIDQSRRGASGAAPVGLGRGGSATFWVYSPADGESTLSIDAAGRGRADLTVNGRHVARLGKSAKGAVFLSGGINKVSVTGLSGRLYLDRLRVTKTTGTLTPTWYQAENAKPAGTATVADYPLATGGKAVTGIGGSPGNDNTLTFDVQARRAGTYAMTVRYSNPEQSPATHYNPDPLARRAAISVNGGPARQVLFPHTFHADNFWELSVPVRLKPGRNTVRFSSEELPDFDGTSYISGRYPDLLLRSRYAPIIDKIAITPYAAAGFGAAPRPGGGSGRGR
ncbi:LamG-like jellyroll fold domain-containing protein [Actinoplanes sp. ATCC 53533]|uniref:LamG-like jellyroll fold domain-containing protein n=1 Tax=Actinoplanes sp. ATCC 53533 TaxID=1288362 RepID=UPI001F1B44BE|nr:LamG-like jellyroll fold domain-containing protein [Actinoplanes sp. ATCC 53533]